MVKKWQEILAKLDVIEGELDLCDEECFSVFEAENGFLLPSAYREFCQILGSGVVGDYVRIYCPNTKYSDKKKEFIREQIEFQESELKSLSLQIRFEDLEIFKEMINSAFIFGDTIFGQYFLWDMRTYSVLDNSCDIYFVELDTFYTYKVGRNFFEFICEFCFGNRFLELLPENSQTDLNSIHWTFDPISNGLWLDEEIWYENLESGTVLGLAQKYEQQEKLTEALVLYIRYRRISFYGALNEYHLWRAYSRLYKALGELEFRKICLAVTGNTGTYRDILKGIRKISHGYVVDRPGGMKYMNFEAYRSDFYSLQTSPIRIKSISNNISDDRLETILIEQIPEASLEFKEAFERFLKLVYIRLKDIMADDLDSF